MEVSLQLATYLWMLYFVDINCSVYGFKMDNFGSKTAYHWSHPPSDNRVDQYFNIVFGPKMCKAVHISGLLRHGARYPSRGEIRKMSELHKRLHNLDTNKKSHLIQTWSSQFANEKVLMLSDYGREEHRLLGQRYGGRLLSMFKENTEKIKLMSSSTDRARVSALSFYEGLSEIAKAHVRNAVEAQINETILRSQKVCSNFLSSVDENATAFHEYVKFQHGSYMSAVVRKVQQRIGVKAVLSADDVEVMSMYCAYELQFFGKSQWCNLFEEADLKVLEYLQDLAKYWVYGYGHEMIADIRCPLVRDIFTTIDSAIHARQTSQAYPPGSFWFAHAGTVSPVYAALGLFNDSLPLRASNYANVQRRTFKTSDILPFAANIAFVLYDCSSENDNYTNYVMKWFVNEKPVTIPPCQSLLCPYETVRQWYRRHIDECDVAQLCSQLELTQIIIP